MKASVGCATSTIYRFGYSIRQRSARRQVAYFERRPEWMEPRILVQLFVAKKVYVLTTAAT